MRAPLRHSACSTVRCRRCATFVNLPVRYIAASRLFFESFRSPIPGGPPVATIKPPQPSLVTIVIPCFNYGQYLGNAIRSAQMQQYRPVEIIVVDDGSTDESAVVAEQAGVRVIRQPNAGLGAARNAGLSEASGEFVLFLDADDELLSDAVATGVSVLQGRPDVSSVVRRCQVMDALDAHFPRVTGPSTSKSFTRNGSAPILSGRPARRCFEGIVSPKSAGFLRTSGRLPTMPCTLHWRARERSRSIRARSFDTGNTTTTCRSTRC